MEPLIVPASLVDRIDRPGPGMRLMGGATRLPAPLDAYPLQTENAS